MAIEHDYACEDCNKPTRRDALVVKRIQFTTMGEGSRIIRSRVKSWLCTDCVKKDSDYNLPRNRRPSDRVEHRITTIPTREEFDLRA